MNRLDRTPTTGCGPKPQDVFSFGQVSECSGHVVRVDVSVRRPVVALRNSSLDLRVHKGVVLEE